MSVMSSAEAEKKRLSSRLETSNLSDKTGRAPLRRIEVRDIESSWLQRNPRYALLGGFAIFFLLVAQCLGYSVFGHRKPHGESVETISTSEGDLLRNNFKDLMESQVHLAEVSRPSSDDKDLATQLQVVGNGISQLSHRVEESDIEKATKNDILGRLITLFQRLDQSQTKYLDFEGQLGSIKTKARQLTAEKIAKLESREAPNAPRRGRFFQAIRSLPTIEEELQDMVIAQAALMRHYLQSAVNVAQHVHADSQALQSMMATVGEVPEVRAYSIAGRYKNSLVAILAMTGGGPRKSDGDKELARQLNAAATLRPVAEQALSPMLFQLQSIVIKLDALHYRVKQQQKYPVKTDVKLEQIIHIMKEGLAKM